MADRADVERVAGGIIEAVSREFPGVTVQLDLDAPTDDHEDAYLWIDAPTDDREDINDVWGFAIKLVQDAFDEEDVYLVARMRGAGIIDRERTGDKE
jgi:hypothetical protein